MKKLILLGIITIFTSSCADEKEFTLNGKQVVVEPYGWWDTSEKNDSIIYKVNGGNIFWSIILSETIVVPIVLTGDQFYEPVRIKYPERVVTIEPYVK